MNKGGNQKKVFYAVSQTAGKITKGLVAASVITFVCGVVATLLLDSNERKNAAKFNKQNK